jgi:hypothetical protein
MLVPKKAGVLRVEFLENYPDQILLANYLRSTGDAKAQVLAATKAFFYPLAMIDQSVDRKFKEIALADALRELDNHRKKLTDYFQILEQINLPEHSEQNKLVQPQSKNQVEIITQAEEEEDDDDDPVCLTLANDDVSFNF